MAGPGRFELTQEQASLCPWLARNYDALRLTLRVTGGGKIQTQLLESSALCAVRDCG